MKVSDLKTELERELRESQNQRDARIEELWRKLDPQKTGELDLKGLQKGLRRIDHPLKNADELLRRVMGEVDTNGDGKIQYEEFRTWVEQAERQLLALFRSIDQDNDSRLDRMELQAAFRKAGLSVPMRRLTAFFSDIDMNNDGYISFDEWRDFLLFMPTQDSGAPLQAVLSFYSSIVTLSAEGDSMVSEETLEGLGTTPSLLQSLFGSIFRILPLDPDAKSKGVVSQPMVASPAPIPTVPPAQPQHEGAQMPLSSTTDHTPLISGSETPENAMELPTPELVGGALERRDLTPSKVARPAGVGTQGSRLSKPPKKARLTDFVPDPGYFLAGAIAGGVSRTATAPLDRLKVYLLVNTKTATNTALAAAKQGRPLLALRNATGPISDAVRDLWRSGGFRTFFAGNGLNVVKIMPETAIKFGSYEAAKRALANFEGHGDPKKINSYSKFTAGGVAGMISQFFVYPLDTLKFRLQCETVKDGLRGNALLVETARKMYRDGGIRSAYRGVTMGIVGMFPYSAIDMGTFELLKTTYKRYMAKYTGVHEEDITPGNFVTGVIGATSGAFGASVVYPLNVLRTRLQTQGTVMHRATYTGIVDVAQKTIQMEGYRGLYKGLTPNLLKVAPALSITWVVYENCKRVLGLD